MAVLTGLLTRVCVIAAGGLAVSGCVEYLDDGSMVRHHFGYVKVITPAVHAPSAAVQAFEVETYGVWVGVDGCDEGLTQTATGVGIGYRSDERLLVPLDCRSVIRVATQDQLDQLLDVLRDVPGEGLGVCVVQDP